MISSFQGGLELHRSIPAPFLHWSRRQIISACPLVPGIPRGSPGRGVREGKGLSPLRAAPRAGAAPRLVLESLPAQPTLVIEGGHRPLFYMPDPLLEYLTSHLPNSLFQALWGSPVPAPHAIKLRKLSPSGSA